MFRLQNNTPEVYVNNSRDFQLFCRLYDSIFNGVKYSTDSLTHTATSSECNNSLLRLLATKLGLFTELNLPDLELRYVLESFPMIIRYKGSMQSVLYIVRLFQRLSRINNLTCSVELDKINRELFLTFSREVSNELLLYELLSYVMPTGFRVVYSFYDNDAIITKIVELENFSWSEITQTENGHMLVNADLSTTSKEYGAQVGSAIVMSYEKKVGEEEQEDEEQ